MNIKKDRMISFNEALEIVLSNAVLTGTEKISFISSEGRVLAEDVLSDTDMPPFNRAAVDGYACRRSDLEKEMEVTEVIPAGRAPQMEVATGHCAKIMTGAIVPEGCDVVFMVEESLVLPSGKVKFTGTNPKSNVSLRGEDVRTGDRVLVAGKILKSQDIAILASVGHTEVLVRKMPEAAVISTGDELVEPSVKPALSQIRNSNAYQLIAQVIKAGGKARYYGIAPDTGNAAQEMIDRAIAENAIVILTGGVSMGDFDFVPSLLEKAGVKILFDRINVQPGKPTTFGVHPKGVVFGLPGNPVSSFIQFETLIRPFMHRMMSSNWRPVILKMQLNSRFDRKSSGRMGWIPVKIKDGEAFVVDYHGSAHLTSLAGADGFFALEPGKTYAEKGEIVNVRLI